MAKAKATKLPAPYPSTNAAADKRWQTEDALRTLTRAQEIQKDRGMMKDVKALAREQAKTLAKVCKPNGK